MRLVASVPKFGGTEGDSVTQEGGMPRCLAVPIRVARIRLPAELAYHLNGSNLDFLRVSSFQVA
ncbi:hypothetical protein RISK_003469 [Rhodopirellula islandica]|uniref:Uncharacterized protein n=1 Tax=Rhodopirellula islandica TaxID=595434 RepID=A0A0J1BCU1_RHOIS|nr:hypothetical protein RISK_003469 [Rhodopirellula islandica]